LVIATAEELRTGERRVVPGGRFEIVVLTPRGAGRRSAKAA
jgi:hypothetical protein